MNIPLEPFPIQFQQNFERGYSLDIKKTRLIENELEKINNDINKYNETLKIISAQLYEKKSELTKNENELKTIRTQREKFIEQRDNYNSDIKKLDISGDRDNNNENELVEANNESKKSEIKVDVSTIEI